MADTLTARTPEQARLLLTYGYQVVLGEVMARPASASPIAQASEVPLKQVHHRLTRLCEAGLVQVVGEQRRGERPIKLYRASAASFRVPFALTQAEDLQALFIQMFTPFLTAYFSHLAPQMHRYSDEVLLRLNRHGQLGVNFGGIRTEREAYQAFGTMAGQRLTPETCRELELKLRDLQAWVQEREAAEKNRAEAQDCLLGLLFTLGRQE